MRMWSSHRPHFLRRTGFPTDPYWLRSKSRVVLEDVHGQRPEAFSVD